MATEHIHFSATLCTCNHKLFIYHTTTISYTLIYYPCDDLSFFSPNSTILWSSTSIVCRHYQDCLICRYHLTIFTTLVPRTKKKFSPSLKPITIARLFQRKNGHRETIGTGAKMATSQTPPFRQGVKVTRFCFYNLTRGGWHSCSFLGGKMEKCFSCRRRRTMDTTPRCTGTKQRSGPA